MQNPSSIRVDRERFLALVSALATISCNLTPTLAQPSAERASDPAQVAHGEVDTEGDAREEPVVFVEAPELPEAQVRAEPEPEPEDPPAPTCDNDVGQVDCSAISSTCEGMRGSCDLLVTHPYRPRVAQAIAACWTRIGDRACNIRARERCNLEGIRQACLDPQFVPECEANLRRCADAGVTPSYTLDECVQVLSSLADAGERSWSSGAMGPTREGCRLMFPVY